MAEGRLTARERAERLVEEAKAVLGQESPPREALYPVEHEPIARFCAMSDDDNPLYLDPEYGKRTKYGATIAPPLSLAFGLLRRGAGGSQGREAGTGRPALRTLGNRAINLGTEWEFFKPVRVGDHIFISSRIAEFSIKPIRLDPLAMWTRSETIYRNQHGEIVAIQSNLGLRHRTPEEVAADDALDREIEAERAAGATRP
jgi:acyl dehydratase